MPVRNPLPKNTIDQASSIFLSAKCSDLCYVELYAKNGKVLADRDGYVPEFMPEDHYGDYVQLRIDLKTGKILNWKVPTKAQINAAFKKED